MTRSVQFNTDIYKIYICRNLQTLYNSVSVNKTFSPVQIRVQTEDREKELTAICAENGWACVIEVDAEQVEDIRSLKVLKNQQTTSLSTKTPNRNDPCSCNSGKKYKKCCGA